MEAPNLGIQGWNPGKVSTRANQEPKQGVDYTAHSSVFAYCIFPNQGGVQTQGFKPSSPNPRSPNPGLQTQESKAWTENPGIPTQNPKQESEPRTPNPGIQPQGSKPRIPNPGLKSQDSKLSKSTNPKQECKLGLTFGIQAKSPGNM